MDTPFLQHNKQKEHIAKQQQSTQPIMVTISIVLYLVILLAALSGLASQSSLKANLKQHSNHHTGKSVKKASSLLNETKRLQRLLDEQFSKFLEQLPFDLSFLQLEENQVKHARYIAKEQDLSAAHSNEDCNKPYELEATVEEFRTCPSQLVAVKRQDRFPNVRLFAKCLCRKCLGNTITSYPYSSSTCLPVKVLMPVLIRSHSSGQQSDAEWKFFLEPVSVSCVCGTKQRPDN
ncbi:hypothetical protein DAPPUDRAFT_125692 [Daphnia pulex]|uniref:Uncharacterized protein n=1 Tax=Daphnia pulex TaxID=6669 RepID=E9I7I2_DAPPU|nr:hypothetical protein DAPPUDRAFT_125692 [Daphnia pulex]|eukprot:EFX60048.1 hypothetical protein DAPPUDRAFT_125692 [Daphnia pulex]